MANPLFNHETIDRAINALDEYLQKRKTSQSDNLLWDEEQDINVVIEPKVNCLKAHTFNSIRIPLVHSFRKDTDNEICIITRSKDVEKWKEVILTTYPVAGVTKIMSVTEFETDYKTQEARVQLGQLFDLFIIHPSVIYRVASKIVPFLRNKNKSCGVLPMAYDLLQLGDTKNPLHVNRYNKLNDKQMQKYSLKLAQMIAKYRDSTYYMNFNLNQKFIKIGESAMDKTQLKENLIHVLNYGLCIIPNGGLNNVMRLSLHINNTNIQLPFYVNLDDLSDYYDIVNPKHINYCEHKTKMNQFKRK
eukprot:125904_1